MTNLCCDLICLVRFAFCRLVVFLILLLSLRNLFAEDEWKLVKGTHFIIQYQNDKRFAEKVLHQAEKNYKRIVLNLGYAKKENFWLWEDRAVISLYKTREEFANAVGAPGWAAGKADYKKRTIAGIEGSEIFIGSVLPHEMGHLVFRDFIGFGDNAPLWLDEGVAQWQDEASRERARKTAVMLYEMNRLMPLAVLTASDIRTVGEAERAVEFYSQSVSLVGFMVEKYGTERFTRFCRKLRDGNSMNDALRFTYDEGLRSIEELERQWSKSLGG